MVGQPQVVDVRITCDDTWEALSPVPGAWSRCSALGMREHLAWWPLEHPGALLTLSLIFFMKLNNPLKLLGCFDPVALPVASPAGSVLKLHELNLL